MTTLRVVHYLNQFFAGVGGEGMADLPPGRRQGAVGPGLALQPALGERGQVVATIFCGDNCAAEREGAIDEIVKLIAREQPDVVVAGPAFAAGRYGLTCGEVCVRVQAHLGATVVTGMHADNPAADLYRTRVCIASTRETAAGTAEAVRTMARLALKLHAGEELGVPFEEGYLPTGRRVHLVAQKNAAERALDLLLRKLSGQPYATEWPVPSYGRVTPAPAIRDLAKARLAVVTTGGVVPRGNPDRLESSFATRWLKYSIGDLAGLESDRWQTVHGGFDTTSANADPDRVVPLDVLRQLEAEGAFGELHDHLYTTVGNCSVIPAMRRVGQEIRGELRKAGVDGVILTST